MRFDLLFNLAFPLWTLIFSVGCIPIVLFFPKRVARFVKGWAQFSLYLLRVFSGIKVKYIGTLPKHGNIIASEHQSVLEILALMAKLDNVVFVLKKELMYLPFVNIYLYVLGMIPINRKRINRYWMNVAEKRLEEGKNLVIFPEGTRVLPGQEVAYKSGVFRLAKFLGKQIIPVAVNTGEFWPRRSWVKKSGEALIIFGDPMEADTDLLKKACNKLKAENIK